MELLNKQVIHKSFGKGIVTEQAATHIMIQFSLENKKFVYPDAFGPYLTLTDKRSADSVQNIIQKNEVKHKLEEIELFKEKALKLIERERILRREKALRDLKIHPSSQAVFWCKPEDQEMVFTEWKVNIGEVKGSNKEGKASRPIRLNQNSACLLTAREPNMPEKGRLILGVYMVGEDFIGKTSEDSYIPAHSKFKIRLSEQESGKMLFWNYYINERFPNRMIWETGTFRYFDNVWMAQILSDIVSLKKGTQEHVTAKNFFEYFCNINRIEASELPKSNGALMRIEN
ncbi:MAG: malate synthase [Christensenellales bacterium]